MRHASKIALAGLLALAPLAGCGQNEAARGIPSTAPENASPESKKEMKETEAQRDEAQVQQEQQRDIQNFDAAQQPQQQKDAPPSQ